MSFVTFSQIMSRASLGIAAMCVCGAVLAQDTVVTVALADYSKWCTPVLLTAEAAKDEVIQQGARAAAVRKMDTVLLKNKGQYSGIPFISNARKFSVKDKAGKSKDLVAMDVCYVVEPVIPDPPVGSVKATKSTGERVATLVCARTAEEQCIERLQAVLANASPPVPLDTVKTWPWRYVATLAAPADPDTVAAAITASRSRPIRGDAQVTVFGDIHLPDPKVKRPLTTQTKGSVITVPVEQGQWFVTAVSLPK